MKNPTRKYAEEILKLLEIHYPNAKMILEWENNWELLVAIILSAQCTDKKVNEVTAKVFPKYRTITQKSKLKSQKYSLKIKSFNNEIFEIINFAEAERKNLEQDIKSTGFYRNKAKNIQEAAKIILGKYQSQIPKTMSELIKIPGVGRKTANVFLGNAYQIYEGIAVDTHVIKQAQILGLTKNTSPDKIEQDLMKLFDKNDWFKLTYLLIEHGRNKRRKKSDRISCNDKKCILCSEK